MYRIRPDVAADVDDASWSLVVVLLLSGLVYLFGGVVFGMRARGERKPTLKAHPHYIRWVQVHGLCQDGLAFARARAGMRRDQPNKRQQQDRLLDDEDRPPSKRNSQKSKSSANKSSPKTASTKSSSGRSDKDEERGRDKAKRREKRARGEKLTKQEQAAEEEEIEEEKQRQLQELADSTGVHSSQAKIKVIGING